MADDRSDDLFDRYEPSRMQILVWVAIGLLLNFAAEPLLVPFLGASMAIVSTYLFVRERLPGGSNAGVDDPYSRDSSSRP